MSLLQGLLEADQIAETDIVRRSGRSVFLKFHQVGSYLFLSRSSLPAVGLTLERTVVYSQINVHTGSGIFLLPGATSHPSSPASVPRQEARNDTTHMGSL